jgi:hypothetical protein
MNAAKIATMFKNMSAVAIVVIIAITSLFTLDVTLDLGWGYSAHDVALGLMVLTFAVILRVIGLRLIAFVTNN